MSFLDEAMLVGQLGLDSDKEGDDNDGQDDKKDDAPEGEKVEPKKVKRRISVQPRLNPERLKGDRGIKAIPEAFKDIKLLGKGHESRDLDKIMTHLAHWAHRLYPKANFEDCLQLIENQGKKKTMSHFMKSFRMDMLDDDIVRQSDGEEEEGAGRFEVPDMEMDELDQMLVEEVNRTSARNTTFDDLGVGNLNSTIGSQFEIGAPQLTSTLTEEQLLRIEENKKRAMERLQKRKAVVQVQESQEFLLGGDEMVVQPVDPPVLSEEQKRVIEENKRRALERLKQRKLGKTGAEEAEEGPSKPPELGSVEEDDHMEPLVYDSD